MLRKIFLSLSTSILLSLAWTEWGLGWLLPFAFFPLLKVEAELSEEENKAQKSAVLLYAYIAFLSWNIISTWWVAKAIIGGGIAANTLNSLFFAILFMLFHIIKKQLGKHTGYSSLIIIWIAFEKVYLDGEISWPWLTLGNGLANNTDLIQWYEYTGILGGSLWILLSNVLIFNIWEQFSKDKRGLIPLIIAGLLVLCLPPYLSFKIKENIKIEGPKLSASIVQPNIDPYNEKFNGLSQEEQLEKMLRLIQDRASAQSDFFILPETALDDQIIENNLNYSISINKIKNFMRAYPNSSMIIGATSYFVYPKGQQTATSKLNPNGSMYDTFNTALQIDQSDSIAIYHKSKLVIGAEMTPYPQFFDFLKKYAFDLGGVSGNYGRQTERSVFRNPYNSAVVAPVICYESIYGEFVTQYIKKGANVIAVITNDGWWGDTQGYRQHFSYSKLRAIETRRFVLRSANTGISAIINPKGEVEKRTAYWEKDLLNVQFQTQNTITFYTQMGDAIGRIMKFLSVLLFLYYITTILKRRQEQKHNY